MSMTVRTNMDALRTLNQMTTNHALAHKHLMKVSTGMKVRDAQDDASAYAISERMRVRIRALDQAHSNTQNGSNMMKTAEGAVSQIIETLKTLKEKAINAANDSNSDEERRMLQKEFNELVDQIDDDALITFNNKYLIDGTRNNAFEPTRTVLLNQNLSEGTTTDTRLTALTNRAGDSLEIQSSDYYQLSWVMNGKLSTASGRVEEKTLADILQIQDVSELQTTTDGQITGITDKFGNEFYTPDRKEGIFVSSPAATTDADELESQLAGFAISITDSEGNVKKAANSALDAFKQYQRAEIQTDDQSLSFHVGADSNFATKFSLTDMRTRALGLKGSDGTIISISTKEDANATINVLDNVLTKVLNQQSTIGSAISRLEHTATNLTTSFTNDQASDSVIRDADMATEMAGYLKYNVLTQASQAMLAQANQNPMNVIALISGQQGE